MKIYAGNIEQETLENKDFRRVIFTGQNSQLVLMTIQPGDEIGTEIHEEHDQFLRVEAGQAKFIINGETITGEDGFAVVVPAGAEHNVVNSGEDELKLYTIYSPAEHSDGTIHHTKADALEAGH
jgi:mannose-6-phosphate isomerase-like protein (cupin superfamily)